MSMEAHEPTPKPSPALLALVRTMRPVPLRRPGRQLLRVVGVSLLYAAAWVAGPAAWIWGRALRVDLGELPLGWLLLFGALWLVGFAAPLTVAMLPRRGQLLHRVGLAVAVAWIGWALLVLGSLTARVAPGASLVAATRAPLMMVTAQCAAAALSVAIVP